MILQRDSPIVVWGEADPGEKVAVTIAGQSQAAVADSAGKWNVTLEKLRVSEGTTLTVKGKNTLVVNDVLVGDVWLFSGQSNVGIPVSRAIDGAKETAAADYPKIRLLTMPTKGSARSRRTRLRAKVGKYARRRPPRTSPRSATTSRGRSIGISRSRSAS